MYRTKLKRQLSLVCPPTVSVSFIFNSPVNFWVSHVSTFLVFSASYVYLSVSSCVMCDQVVICDPCLAALIISGKLCKPEISALCNALTVLFCNKLVHRSLDWTVCHVSKWTCFSFNSETDWMHWALTWSSCVQENIWRSQYWKVGLRKWTVLWICGSFLNTGQAKCVSLPNILVSVHTVRSDNFGPAVFLHNNNTDLPVCSH